MALVTKMFIRARESVVRNTRGQTMTEYALILAAIAIVVYGTYRVLGNSIGSLASGVDSALTSAERHLNHRRPVAKQVPKPPELTPGAFSMPSKHPPPLRS